MVIAGSLAQRRAWAGLLFDCTDEVIVPEVLVPVHCDTDYDHAVYVEPDIWDRTQLIAPDQPQPELAVQ